MELEKIELAEVTQLEPLVLNNLGRIEKGLKALDHQMSIGASGRPDILAVDESGALTLIELKSIPADLPALAQIIRYYEWFSQNLALVARPFPVVKPEEEVRLILVAPEVDPELVQVARYLALTLDVYRYIAIKHGKSGDVGLVFDAVDVETPDGPVPLRSVEDIVAYCEDENVRKQLVKVVTDLNRLGVVFRPHQGGKYYWIEGTFQGDPIAYIQPRRKFFNFQHYDWKKDDWATTTKLVTFAQWSKQCRKRIVSEIQNCSASDTE